MIIDAIFTKGIDKHYHKNVSQHTMKAPVTIANVLASFFHVLLQVKYVSSPFLVFFILLEWPWEQDHLFDITTWNDEWLHFVSGTVIYPRCGLKLSSFQPKRGANETTIDMILTKDINTQIVVELQECM